MSDYIRLFLDYTVRYRNALQRCDRQVWMFGVEEDSALLYGCLAELQAGRIRSELHIQSTPANADEIFWSGLLRFCRERRVTALSLGTIGTAPSIPDLARVQTRKCRTEYWVDLLVDDLRNSMRPEQRRICNRAAERGFEIRQPNVDGGLTEHKKLTNASLGRRRNRGEEIPFFDDSPLPRALIDSGASRIYECTLDGRVLGSAIFSVAREAAHGYSAGFSHDALKLGVGPYLNLMTFQILKAEGKRLFNLGDAPPDSGLAMFKRGLGGTPMESSAVIFDVAGQPKRGLIAVQSALQAARGYLRKRQLVSMI